MDYPVGPRSEDSVLRRRSEKKQRGRGWKGAVGAKGRQDFPKGLQRKLPSMLGCWLLAYWSKMTTEINADIISRYGVLCHRYLKMWKWRPGKVVHIFEPST